MDAKILKLKTLTSAEHEQVDRMFLFRECPSDDQYDRLSAIHDEARIFAVFIREHTRESHEQGRAIIHLREAVAWAVEAIRLEPPGMRDAVDMMTPPVGGDVKVAAPPEGQIGPYTLISPGSV